MKIQTIETYSKETIALVKVIAEDGSAGWGQVSPYQADLSSLVLHRQVAPYALGMEQEDLERVVHHRKPDGRAEAAPLVAHEPHPHREEEREGQKKAGERRGGR